MYIDHIYIYMYLYSYIYSEILLNKNNKNK